MSFFSKIGIVLSMVYNWIVNAPSTVEAQCEAFFSRVDTVQKKYPSVLHVANFLFYLFGNWCLCASDLSKIFTDDKHPYFYILYLFFSKIIYWGSTIRVFSKEEADAGAYTMLPDSRNRPPLHRHSLWAWILWVIRSIAVYLLGTYAGISDWPATGALLHFYSFCLTLLKLKVDDFGAADAFFSLASGFSETLMPNPHAKLVNSLAFTAVGGFREHRKEQRRLTETGDDPHQENFKTFSYGRLTPSKTGNVLSTVYNRIVNAPSSFEAQCEAMIRRVETFHKKNRVVLVAETFFIYVIGHWCLSASQLSQSFKNDKHPYLFILYLAVAIICYVWFLAPAFWKEEADTDAYTMLPESRNSPPLHRRYVSPPPPHRHSVSAWILWGIRSMAVYLLETYFSGKSDLAATGTFLIFYVFCLTLLQLGVDDFGASDLLFSLASGFSETLFKNPHAKIADSLVFAAVGGYMEHRNERRLTESGDNYRLPL